MASNHLPNDEFLTRLSALLASTQTSGHGSVHLSQKRMTFDPSTPTTDKIPDDPLWDLRPWLLTFDPSAPTTDKVPDDPLWDLHPPNPLPLLVRATDGKSTQSDKKTKNADKVKISTVVQPDDLEAFFARYADVCKAGMSGLRKRDRSKRKKDKGKKKKGAAGEGEKKG